LTTLLASTFVVGREGFEAWLIAMLALASSGGNIRNIRAIWMAVIASVIATLALGSITAQFLGSHANIERFEGVIGVFTVLYWPGLLGSVTALVSTSNSYLTIIPYC
jgi:high-affinity Fe2+/Pb2+ permease